jgi:hypothetical protein
MPKRSMKLLFKLQKYKCNKSGKENAWKSRKGMTGKRITRK